MVEATQNSSSEGVTNDTRLKMEPELKAGPRISDFPKDVTDIIYPALPIGGLSGVSGILYGGFTGVLRATKHPMVLALTTGTQFATFGTTFDISRSSILHYFGRKDATSGEKLQASAAAGTIGGALASTIRGSIRALPAAALCTLLGAAGQYSYNRSEARSMDQSSQDENAEKHPWLNSKFSPMKVLTDQEYNVMLQEKLLNVNAQIALIDESIEALRKQEKEDASRVTEESGKPGSG